MSPYSRPCGADTAPFKGFVSAGQMISVQVGCVPLHCPSAPQVRVQVPAPCAYPVLQRYVATEPKTLPLLVATVPLRRAGKPQLTGAQLIPLPE